MPTKQGRLLEPSWNFLYHKMSTSSSSAAGSALYRYEQAVNILDKGYTDEGMELLADILNDPNAGFRVHTAVVVRRAQEFRANNTLQGSIPTAITELSKIINFINRNNPQINANALNANRILSAGLAASSTSVVDPYLVLSPSSATNFDARKVLVSAIFERAECFWKIRKVQLCLEDLNEILSNLNPDHFKARIRRAEILLAENEFKGALVDLDFAVQLKPSSPEAYLARSCAKLDYLNKLPRGFVSGPKDIVISIISDLRKCLFGNADFSAISDDSRIQCTVNLAHCYMHPEIREFSKCVEVSSSAIKLLKKAKLRATIRTNDVTDFERDLELFVSRHEDNLVQLMAFRAESLFEQRKFPEALIDFNEVHQMISKPSQVSSSVKFAEIEMIQLKRAMCMAQIGQNEDSIAEVFLFMEWLKHNQSKDPDLWAKALDVMGTCLYRSGKLKKALNMFQNACDINPMRPDLKLKLKRVQAQVEKQQVHEEKGNESATLNLQTLTAELQLLLAPLADHLTLQNVRAPNDSPEEVVAKLDKVVDYLLAQIFRPEEKEI